MKKFSLPREVSIRLLSTSTYYVLHSVPTVAFDTRVKLALLLYMYRTVKTEEGYEPIRNTSQELIIAGNVPGFKKKGTKRKR